MKNGLTFLPQLTLNNNNTAWPQEQTPNWVTLEGLWLTQFTLFQVQFKQRTHNDMVCEAVRVSAELWRQIWGMPIQMELILPEVIFSGHFAVREIGEDFINNYLHGWFKD